MGLTRNTGDNLGGLARVWIARKSIVAPYFSRNTLTLTKLQLESLLEEVEFKPGDAYPDRGATENAHGLFRQFRLLLQVDKQSAERDAFLEKHEGRELVAIGLDHHGTYHLFGQPDWPLTFTSDLDFGAQPPEGQQYSLTFSGLIPLKTPRISIS